MSITTGWIKWVLHFRFTRAGMLLESFCLESLGAIYFGGDQVDWLEARTKAYYMWHEGRTPQWIADHYQIPGFFVNNWVTVWMAYDKAWGWLA